MIAVHEAKMNLKFQSIGPRPAKEHSNTEESKTGTHWTSN